MLQTQGKERDVTAEQAKDAAIELRARDANREWCNSLADLVEERGQVRLFRCDATQLREIAEQLREDGRPT